MTPAVARDFAQDIATRRSEFMEVVRDTLSGLQKLNIKHAELVLGTADLAFLVPREIFKNHLDAFAKELSFINRLLQNISKGVTGSATPITLSTLSSSIPTIGLETGLKVIEVLANIVVKFLEAWERISKIRKVRLRRGFGRSQPAFLRRPRVDAQSKAEVFCLEYARTQGITFENHFFNSCRIRNNNHRRCRGIRLVVLVETGGRLSASAPREAGRGSPFD